MKCSTRFLVAAGVGFGLIVLGSRFVELRLFGLWLAGRSPNCPLVRALASASHREKLMAEKDRILTETRLLAIDPAGYRHWQTPLGDYWIPDKDPYTLAFNLAEQVVGIYRSTQVRVQPGDVVVDCGANVGVFTRQALMEGARLVVAVEPALENLECLRRNLAKEIEAGRVLLCPKGVWSREGELRLRVDPRTHAADTFVMQPPGWQQGPVLPVTTVDRLVQELGLARVDFIKMDIEGAELEALKGARRTLRRWRPRLAISAYHAPDHPIRIPELVRQVRADYRWRCGPCSATEDGWIRPDVLLFH